MFLELCILILLAFAGDPLVAEEWPQFRGPAANGISNASNTPVKWSATENVAWKTPIPGRGWSSPVVAEGTIFLTTALAEDAADQVSLRALAIDAVNGNILWNVEVFRPEPAAAKQMHDKNTLASPTPIVEDGRLYVHFGHMGTAVLDLSGNVLWRQEKLAYTPTHGNGGSPMLVDDLLVFSCDAASDPFVVALDRQTGEIRWRTPRNSRAQKTFSFCTPIVIEVGGRKQIVSPGSGFVGGYDARNGHEDWRVSYGEGYSVVPRPVFANGLLFVCTGFNQPSLLAIDLRDGSDVNDDQIVWSQKKGAPLTPSPIVVGRELYTVSDNGVATCFDTRTGKPYWTKRLGGAFSASPVFAEGRIYFTSEDGLVSVVSANTEYELLAANDLGERTLASPAVTEDALILRTDSHLWRIEE